MNRFQLFIGLRYAGTRSDGQLMSFLARLAMLGLVLGVSLLIVVMSVMNGFDREMRERILSLVPHVSVYSGSGAIPDWRARIDTLLQQPQVVAAAPFLEVEAMLKHRERVAPVMFYAVDVKYEQMLSPINQFVSDTDFARWEQDRTSIMLGASRAEKLGVNAGDNIAAVLIPHQISDVSGKVRSDQFLLQTFHVAAVFDTGTQIDKSLVIAHLDYVGELIEIRAPVGIRLQVEDLFKARQVQWQVAETLPQNFYVKSWTQSYGNLYEAIQLSRGLVSLLMLIIIAVAVFNVVSTLMLVVIEKSNAIAILRTQGARRRDIVSIFIIQGGVIGALGAGFGALLGILFSLGIESFAQWLQATLGIQFLDTSVYPINYIPADLIGLQVAVVVTVAVVFSLLAACYPAWRAARIEPAVVLRHE